MASTYVHWFGGLPVLLGLVPDANYLIKIVSDSAGVLHYHPHAHVQVDDHQGCLLSADEEESGGTYGMIRSTFCHYK